MANPIVERLIAAGASPQRARAFATQFAASQPTNLRSPQSLEDAFDQQLADASYNLPGLFKVPKVGTPGFDEYYDFLVSNKRVPGVASVDENTLYDKAATKFAPNYNKAFSGLSGKTQQEIANQFAQGKTLFDVQNYLVTNAGTIDIPATEGLKIQDKLKQANDTSTKLYEEYIKFQQEADGFVTSALETNTKARGDSASLDKNFKFGLPDPALKYGSKTDLKAGTIDFRLFPSVPKILATKEAEIKTQLGQTYGAAGPQSSAAAGIAHVSPGFERSVLDSLIKKGFQPYKDEVKRRVSIKGKDFK